MKNISEITLYDLMADDHNVWLRRDKRGYIIEIEDDEGNHTKEEEIHPFAADGLADFCKRYLCAYEKATST